MTNRNVQIEYALPGANGTKEWITMLQFNTTRDGVVQALSFASTLEQQMLAREAAADVRITVTAEVLGFSDILFYAHGSPLREVLESSWRYGFVTES